MAEENGSDVDEALLARVAWLYYNDGLTQSEVGDLLNLSRIKVSRLLEAGRASGLIQIRINSRYQGCLEMETELSARFDLSDCRVIPDGPQTNTNERLGEAAAQYLMQKLPPGSLLAVGWGETVSLSIRKLGHVAQERGVGLVSLTGGVGTYLDGMRAANWDRNVHIVPAPLIVGDESLAQALRHEASVERLMDMALGADFKLVGIGGLSEKATIVSQGFISPSEVEPLRRRGAVGDILCQFYDRDGALIDLPMHGRVIGVSLDRLRDTEKVVGAAGGPSKVEAILAALRGSILDILVTDEATARMIIARAGG